jgi:putative transposase
MSAPLEIGNFVVQNKRQFQIKHISQNGEFELEDTFTKAIITITRRELNDSIFLGSAVVISSDSRSNELHVDNAQDFHSYSDELKAIARKRYMFVKAFRDGNVKGCSEQTLSPLIEQVCAKAETALISWRTLKRWIDAYDDYGIKGLIPRTKSKGNRKSRKQDEVEKLILAALTKYKSSRRPTFKTAFQYLNDDILLHNESIKTSGSEYSTNDLLDTISYQGFINRAKKIAPVDLITAYLGKKKVANKFRVARKPDKALYILDRAEIDHTGGDCFVVDDLTRLPLGRPTLTSVLDKKSKSLLGAYISFEAPSYVSVARAMKHAISDKTDFLKRFPAVEGDWPCRGAFTEIAYDRGAEFESDLLEDALSELQIVGRGNPAGMPWYKGAVESFFKTVNQSFLDDKPGKVFANLFESNEYDPQKNAVISLSEFLETFYVWVVDIYMKSPHGADEVVPYVSWKLDERYIDIEPISPKKLELIFSENTTAQNRDDGLVYETIKYDNELLLRWRKQYGKQKLTFKINRENLSSIQVLNSKDNKYHTVKAVDQEYTENLTYYQHKVCRRYRKKLAKESVNEVSLAEARKRIADIINQSFKSTRKAKLAHSKVASRFQNLGQDSVNKNTLTSSNVNAEKPSPPSVPKGNVESESVSDFLKEFPKN